MNLFASKNPPDNTIKRIEALETQINEVKDHLQGINTDELTRRVQSLETRADKADKRFDKDEDLLRDHERRIKALEAMDLTASAPVTGEIDTAMILKQVNLLKSE